jgi:hypothetical protein
MNILIALLTLFLHATVPPAQVQLGTTVRPETTTVGQHFVATVRVRVPAGTEVRFPARPDSDVKVDSAGAATRSDTTSGGFTESTMNYVLAAWDTGTQRLGLDSVTVVADGTERIAPLSGFNVYVRSVLPADTALRKPKPFRPVVAGTVINWRPWAIAAAVLALLAIMFLAWRRWRRNRTAGLTPLQLAQREFARIDSQRLVESGETERYAVEMVRVVRGYLASAVPAIAASATTHEIARSLAPTSAIPAQRLLAILEETDLIKFARGRAKVERAVEIGAESRRIVNETAAALEAEKAAATSAAAVAKRKAA